MSAVTIVPHKVERGMLRVGSMTLSAGTVADSSPSSGHKVRIAAAVTAETVNGCGSTLITEGSARPSSRNARATTASSGMSLSTVVTSWKIPTCFQPRQLTNVRIQTSPQSAADASPRIEIRPAGLRINACELRKHDREQHAAHRREDPAEDAV